MIHKHHPNPPTYETELLSALTYARCFETETAWILVNAGGKAEEGYIGGSGVWMPLRGKVGGCKSGEEELVVVDVDLGVLQVSHSFNVGFWSFAKRRGSGREEAL